MNYLIDESSFLSSFLVDMLFMRKKGVSELETIAQKHITGLMPDNFYTFLL